MPLPLKPPIKPQLARSATELPTGDGWRYEPKWDGFRTIVFRDGDEVYLQSRNGRPMNRYFPEVAPDLLTLSAERMVTLPKLAEPNSAIRNPLCVRSVEATASSTGPIRIARSIIWPLTSKVTSAE